MAQGVRAKDLTTDLWDVLMGLQPDVAILQEVRPPQRAYGGHLHLNPTRRGWGTAVWSGEEFSSLGEVPAGDAVELERELSAVRGYVASAEIEAPTASLTVVSVHAYPARVPDEYLEELDLTDLIVAPATAVWPGDILWRLTRGLPTSGRSAILGGDWNTARLFDEVYGPRGNHEFFVRMSETGWFEAIRKFFDTEVQTYFRPGRGAYQLDHVFLTEDLYSNLSSAEVVTTDEILSASDHAPMVLTIDL
jgi:endonuclease/exonuclease/phosphatase family metal-dependent hydrolase